MCSLVTFTFGPFETMSGNRIPLERGLWPCKRTLLTPASTSSRIEEPLAVACSFNFRYRGRGMSTVVRIDPSFIKRLLHVPWALHRRLRLTTSKSPALSQRTREGQGTRFLRVAKGWASPPTRHTWNCPQAKVRFEWATRLGRPDPNRGCNGLVTAAISSPEMRGCC